MTCGSTALVVVETVAGRVPVVGRLALVLGYLVANGAVLDLDAADMGQLRVSWGNGHLKASAERFLPPLREPWHGEV